jgi:N-acetylneuraminic acid mutarotase
MGKVFSKNKSKSKGKPLEEKSVYELYIFGQNSSNANFILAFDKNKHELVRQETPKGVEFYNYSGTAMKNESTVIVCGGINQALNNITKKCYELNLKTLKVTLLPDMIRERYTFPIVYKNNKIYALGGRQYGNDDVSIINHCEVYNYETHQWTSIAPMNKSRCTASCFIYKDQIWMIGGYSGPTHRTRKIEKYNEEENAWEVVPLKLYAGFDAANLLTTDKPDQFIVLGGKYANDSSKSVFKYDMNSQTVLNISKLRYSNLITKCVRLSNGQYLNVGYDKEPFYQFFDPQSHKLVEDKATIVSINGLANFKQYNHNTNTTVIPSSHLRSVEHAIPVFGTLSDGMPLVGQNEYSGADVNYRPPTNLYPNETTYKNYVFGTDEEPFQLEIDTETGEVSLSGIPTSLRLQNFQGVCRTASNKVVFAGGINVNFNKISHNCFEYNLETKEIKKLEQMKSGRYTFPLVKFKHYLYAIGGREYGDDQVSIYRTCERFNLETKKWEWAPNLQIPRCTAGTFVTNGRLFVMGGYVPKIYRTNSIEVLNEKREQWELTGLSLPDPIEATVLLTNYDKIFYCSGRTNKGDVLDKYSFQITFSDFDEVHKFPETCKVKACLNKVIVVQNSYIVFGGFKLSEKQNYEVLDTQTFLSISPSHQSVEIKRAIACINELGSKACFSDHFLKRHSSVRAWVDD